jgi:hypothetical protein
MGMGHGNGMAHTFDSELLFDVLEVVGIFGVEGTSGGSQRHD